MLEAWEKMLAKRAYQKGWVRRSDLAQALRKYFKEGKTKNFSKLLVELKLLTQEQVSILEQELREFQQSEGTASQTQLLMQSLWLPKLPRYEVLTPLAEGGMGIVFEGVEKKSRKKVAIKVLKDRDPENRQRFLREIRIARELQHPNILPILDFGQEGEWIFFVMPFIEGEDLDDWIYRRGPLPPLQALRLISLIGEAVRYAHRRGIIHRDLKPSNILIDKRGIPLLSDFGLAKHLTKQTVSITRTGSLIGTPEYMSPEQARGEIEEVSYSSDIYGLGAVLYFCLTGKPPFEGENLIQVLHRVAYEEPVPLRKRNPSIPEDIAAFCHRCLHKEVRSRPQNMDQFLKEVQQLLRKHSTSASSTSRRSPFVWICLLLFLLLAIFAVLYFSPLWELLKKRI